MAVELTERRMGIDWCVEHKQPAMFCCADTAGDAPPSDVVEDEADDKPRPAKPHQWGGYNALRRYTGLMIKGAMHPFQKAGGEITGVAEGDEGLEAALGQATTERIRLDSLIATAPVTPQHIGLMLRGKAPEVRTGGPFEDPELPTVIRMGSLNVLADGHHRATAAWSSGATHMKARVLSGVTPTFANHAGLLLEPE